ATIADMSGNSTLQELMRLFHDAYRGFLSDRRMHFAVGRVAECGHREIVDAIKAGDAEAAGRAMVHHLRVSKQQSLVEELEAVRLSEPLAG
ncbi:MAG: FadR family transcriptional regulator, partial [Anaerolineae bacterium]|nr:FadR family transcriptional regulator [Anaerolineae bacterium]